MANHSVEGFVRGKAPHGRGVELSGPLSTAQVDELIGMVRAIATTAQELGAATAVRKASDLSDVRTAYQAAYDAWLEAVYRLDGGHQWQ